jgi:hypothetical protein
MLHKRGLNESLTLVMESVLNSVNGVKKFRRSFSNYRKFGNLVNTLLRAAEEGRPKGTEVFLFTDNQAAKGAYYHGTSPSWALFELVVTLYKL